MQGAGLVFTCAALCLPSLIPLFSCSNPRPSTFNLSPPLPRPHTSFVSAARFHLDAAAGCVLVSRKASALTEANSQGLCVYFLSSPPPNALHRSPFLCLETSQANPITLGSLHVWMISSSGIKALASPSLNPNFTQREVHLTKLNTLQFSVVKMGSGDRDKPRSLGLTRIYWLAESLQLFLTLCDHGL